MKTLLKLHTELCLIINIEHLLRTLISVESNGTLSVSIMIVVGCWDGRVGGGRYNRYPSEEGRGRSTSNFLSGRG